MSVMSIGMGIPMTDFMVREARHITKGPLAIIRYFPYHLLCLSHRADLVESLALALAVLLVQMCRWARLR